MLALRPTYTLYLFASFASVLAHGYVQNVMADGQAYPGWYPFVDPYTDPPPIRIVRRIPSDGPITSVSDPDLACNKGGQTGTALVAEVSAGSSVILQWTNWPSDHLGPVSTYMTSCNGACESFDVTGAPWFKIDAAGYSGGRWASQDLIADNNSWTSVIPAALSPGEYLVRHEIIALHSIGAPQFYPSCAQVQVRGSGTGFPSDQDVTSIPGVYDGVQWPDIYSDFGSFPIPGPDPARLDGSSVPATPSPTGKPNTPKPSPALPNGPTPPSQPWLHAQCHLKIASK